MRRLLQGGVERLLLPERCHKVRAVPDLGQDTAQSLVEARGTRKHWYMKALVHLHTLKAA